MTLRQGDKVSGTLFEKPWTGEVVIVGELPGGEPAAVARLDHGIFNIDTGYLETNIILPSDYPRD